MAWLDRIVEHKRGELTRAKLRVRPDWLRQQAEVSAVPRSFARVLCVGSAPRVIAEVKRASPSRGVLQPSATTLDWDGVALARAYERAGAVALSVLTDVRFFWGSPDLVGACREATTLPLLRKEFVLDPYQIDESRWLGADAVLLIVRLLDRSTLNACASRARALGMDVLVEVHHAKEIEAALAVEDALIGINHRDLDTGAVDADLALRLRPQIPADRIVVAESGMHSAADLSRLMQAGIETFLVGESLASQVDPERALTELRRGL